MLRLETLNELTLKVTCDGSGNDILYSKAGAYIAGESYGGKNYKFEKMLLGPGGNPVGAALGQIGRRLTGENLPIMMVKSNGANITYYANKEQHVTVLRLAPGQELSAESESLLAWTGDIKYGVRFLAQGVISQKGLATSTLKATGNNAQVAVLSDGNPIVISNMRNGSVLTADPDATVCWVGSDPSVGLDVGWKTLLGRGGRSGESYFFEWKRQAIVIVQPNERESGIDIGIDGKGGKPTQQDNRLFRQDGNQGNFNSAVNIGNMIGHSSQGLEGLGGVIGNILGS